jgi:hypothetical protein
VRGVGQGAGVIVGRERGTRVYLRTGGAIYCGGARGALLIAGCWLLVLTAARARRQGESIGGRPAGLGRHMAGSGRFEANPSASTPAPAQQQQDLGNTEGA